MASALKSFTLTLQFIRQRYFSEHFLPRLWLGRHVVHILTSLGI